MQNFSTKINHVFARVKLEKKLSLAIIILMDKLANMNMHLIVEALGIPFAWVTQVISTIWHIHSEIQ